MPHGDLLLLERDAETARIDDALTLTAGGRGAVVVVEGAPGIGKTHLLSAAVRTAQDRGFTVLRARAGEMEQSFAFGVTRQLFDPLIAGAGPEPRARYLEGAADLAAPLFDPARLTDALGEAMYPLLHGLYWLVANVARERPLLLCVDDAQWADEPSLLFLEFLARRVADLPVAVLVATRPVHAATARSLAGLVADATSETLHPAELSHGSIAGLLEAELGVVSEPVFTDACLATTGGNPFLVRELARLLASEGMAPIAANVTRVSALGPKAVNDSVLIRVAQLPEGARPLLDAVAVLGDGAPAGDAAALSGLDVAAVERLAEALRGAAVLAAGPLLTFTHPVVRAAVYESIAPAERERVHIAAAQALAAAGRPAERVAAHVLGIERPLGAWVNDPLRDAAAQALALGDVATAQRVLRRALVEELEPAAAEPLRATLGHAQVLSMDPAGAETLSAVLNATDDPALAAQAASDLGLMLLFSGQIDAFVAVMGDTEAAIASRAPDLAAHLFAGLLSAAQISFAGADRLADRLDAIRPVAGPATTVAERAELVALAYRGVVEGHPAADVRSLLRRALDFDGVEARPGDVLVGPMQACGPLVLAELYDETHALCSAELESARRHGSAFATAMTLTVRSWCGLRSGDLIGAETDAREALELIEAGGFVSFSTGMAQATLLDCARETGAELGRLDAILDAPAPDADLCPSSIPILARALALAGRGEPEAALAALLEVGESVYADVSPAFLPWRSATATILAGLGRHAEAVALADDELARARVVGMEGPLGVALRVRASLAPADDAHDLLAEAVAVLETSGARLEHARALVDLGALLRRGGQRVESRELLRAGHEIAVPAGATVLAAHARRELAASGLRLAAPGLSGARSLTPSERRVAEMAAAGMRNREIAQGLFVTEKTVETHLSRSYDKLNIRSRSALGEALKD